MSKAPLIASLLRADGFCIAEDYNVPGVDGKGVSGDPDAWTYGLSKEDMREFDLPGIPRDAVWICVSTYDSRLIDSIVRAVIQSQSAVVSIAGESIEGGGGNMWEKMKVWAEIEAVRWEMVWHVVQRLIASGKYRSELDVPDSIWGKRNFTLHRID